MESPDKPDPMQSSPRALTSAAKLSRRDLFRVAAAGVASSYPLRASTGETKPVGAEPDVDSYFTPQADFGTVERGNPLPYTLVPPKLAAAGLSRETWKLEV